MSDLLPLLDKLDRLRVDAARADGCIPEDSDAGWCIWATKYLTDSPADTAFVVSLRLNYPRLSAALRAVLTPATEGEREAREALVKVDHKTSCGAIVRPGWACGLVKGHEGPCGTYVYGVRCHEWKDHLRHVLALLDAERAKAADIDDRHQSQIADYQQEVGRLRGALEGERAKERG